MRSRIAALLSLLFLLSCSSGRSQSELDRAIGLAAEGRTEEALQGLQTVIQKYPGTPAARVAQEKLPLYQGLVDAHARFPVRQAMDILRQTGRAVEDYRLIHGRLPRSLDEVVPGHLPSAPLDPWGSELIYRQRQSGYKIVCLGSDRELGGSGDAMDLKLEDGRVTAGPNWAEW